ncbi:trypsin-like peptidase domain-containing protein [Plantibacter sp. VKM Ac-2885]|nr:PDZ domain-containing protein [Plantibacter sp. PA-3-X8]MBF4510967.1 trypsin-like peptidase domain-containing protein [Plantibacter sp. VKM Ac-2885]
MISAPPPRGIPVNTTPDPERPEPRPTDGTRAAETPQSSPALDPYQPPTGSYQPQPGVDVTPPAGYPGNTAAGGQRREPTTPFGYATAPHATSGQVWPGHHQGPQGQYGPYAAGQGQYAPSGTWQPQPYGQQTIPQPLSTTGTPAKKQPIGWIIAAATAATVVSLVTGGLGLASLAAGAFQSVAASSQVTETVPDDGGQSFRAPGGQPGPQQATPDAATANTRSATAAESVGVVDIDTELAYQGAAAAGTGMILTADGQILTNNHVVAGATSIVVTVVATGEKYDARVVGTDATNDVALLQLDGASGLDTVTIDDDGGAAVGDAVTGVGNAGGTGGTPSAADGSVTALEQDITVQDEATGAGKQLTGLIQTDADIQSGDSGGPLYDSEGEVVGVDTAASSGGTDIDGFAIPIDDALSIVDQIRTGVETDTVTIGYPAFIGIGLAASGAAQTVPGAVVGSVIENTPAASIGLAAGDVITGLNGVAIDSAQTLTATMATLEPGQTVSVTWTTASGTSQTADVTLIEGPVG